MTDLFLSRILSYQEDELVLHVASRTCNQIVRYRWKACRTAPVICTLCLRRVSQKHCRSVCWIRFHPCRPHWPWSAWNLELPLFRWRWGATWNRNIIPWYSSRQQHSPWIPCCALYACYDRRGYMCCPQNLSLYNGRSGTLAGRASFPPKVAPIVPRSGYMRDAQGTNPQGVPSHRTGNNAWNYGMSQSGNRRVSSWFPNGSDAT